MKVERDKGGHLAEVRALAWVSCRLETKWRRSCQGGRSGGQLDRLSEVPTGHCGAKGMLVARSTTLESTRV